MVDFQPDTMEKLVIKDRVMIKAYGVGLKLLDLPDVKLFNISPNFLEAINPEIKNGKLVLPVTHKVPAKIMGSGLGGSHVNSGDYDITLFSEEAVNEYGLDTLRFGDLVAIIDADHSYGRIYRKGSMSVGVISHSNCITAGHGPGVTSLFTSTKGAIKPIIENNANIAKILELRDDV